MEINLKDFKDTLVLMLEHPLGSPSQGNKYIDIGYICKMMAKDWGFYYTFTTNLKRVLGYILEFSAITEEEGAIIRSRIQELLDAIETEPKSIKWKLRSKIGTRKIWYQEVTEKSAQF